MPSRRGFVIAAAASIAVVPTGYGIAEPSEVENGFFWQELRADHRLFYVLDFRAGSYAINDQWEIDTQSRNGRPDPSSGGLETRTISNSPAAEQAAKYADFGGVANGQLVDGLDALYNDFHNKRIRVQDAMQYVKDQVKGKDPTQLEKNLDVLRKFAARPSGN